MSGRAEDVPFAQLGGSELLKDRFFSVTLPYLRAMRTGTLVATPQTWAARGQGQLVGGIGDSYTAVIPVMGLLTQRGSWYGMSLESIRQQLRAHLADPGVGAIVLEIDSPGGAVSGVEELAAEIRDGRQKKPIFAISNCLAASAAYYLAAQAQELFVTPSGEVGSIGVYAAHEDWSRALDQMGVTITLISAGEGKVDGNPYEPLTDDVRAELQEAINRYYAMFLSAVSLGRGVAASRVSKTWKAKIYGARDAVAIGMADAVGTLDDVLRRAIASSASGSGSHNAAMLDSEVTGIRRRRQRLLNPEGL